MQLRGTALLAGVAVVAALLGASTPALAGPYEDGLERARDLAEAKRFAEAQQELLPLVELFPDDYALVLELAWMSYLAEDYPRALRYYQRAHDLSEGSFDSRLGLAWTTLELGKREAAHQMFRELADEGSEDQRVADGLALSHPAAPSPEGDRFTPQAYLIFHSYAAGREASGLSLAVDGRALIADHLRLRLNYRFSRFEVANDEDGSGMMGMGNGGDPGTSSYDQHDVYASLGVQVDQLGADLHGGLIYDASGATDPIYIVGASGYLATLGLVSLEANAVIRPDDAAWRAGASWTVPYRSLWTQGGFSTQGLDEADDLLASAFVGGGLDGGRAGASAGAKIGRERSPAYLQLPAFYDLSREICAGTWVGGYVALSPHWQLFASWELLLTDSEFADAYDAHHFVVLGIGKREE